MQIITVPYASDNYGYFVYRQGQHGALIIDPGEAAPFVERAHQYEQTIAAILCTHHHADHVGGVGQVLHHFPGAKVYAHPCDKHRILRSAEPAHCHAPMDNHPLYIEGFEVTALFTPGHTRGSICWRIGDHLWTGDTLFTAGCGRLFDGTAEQMCDSLYRVINSLPSHTQLYCGHNYALSNLRFAQSVEPENIKIRERINELTEIVQKNGVTVPSTLSAERKTNPFLRCDKPEVASFAYQYIKNTSSAIPTTRLSLVQVFQAIREAKNRFTC